MGTSSSVLAVKIFTPLPFLIWIGLKHDLKLNFLAKIKSLFNKKFTNEKSLGVKTRHSIKFEQVWRVIWLFNTMMTIEWRQKCNVEDHDERKIIRNTMMVQDYLWVAEWVWVGFEPDCVNSETSKWACNQAFADHSH